ncbi:MAG: hypothetical protein ACI4GW_14485 [Lachnospiraceae bacterium]
MKKTVKLFIAVALVLTLVAGSIVVSDIRDKEKTDVNAEEVIAEADTTVDVDTEADKADTKTTDADTEQTTDTTSATTEAATERPATTTERPAATTEAPASNHTHNWVKVVDRAAYDEPIYTEKPVYEERPVYETQTTYVDRWTWPDGSDASALADPARKVEWCAWHCTRCFPDCPDPDPRGYCAFQIHDWTEEVTTRVQTGTEKVQVGTEKIQTGTKHHDEEYHYECSECGARK